MQGGWQGKRDEINHDWLKNEYLKAADAFITRLAQQQPDLERVREFLTDLLEWESRRDELLQLIAGAEDALSPRRLFDEPPLSRCGPETLEWLPSVMHGLWLMRYPIKDSIEAIVQAVDSVDAAYAVVMRILDRPTRLTDIDKLRNDRQTFVKFSDALRTLSAAISSLPHRILVV